MVIEQDKFCSSLKSIMLTDPGSVCRPQDLFLPTFLSTTCCSSAAMESPWETTTTFPLAFFLMSLIAFTTRSCSSSYVSSNSSGAVRMRCLPFFPTNFGLNSLRSSPQLFAHLKRASILAVSTVRNIGLLYIAEYVLVFENIFARYSISIFPFLVSEYLSGPAFIPNTLAFVSPCLTTKKRFATDVCSFTTLSCFSFIFI